MKIRKGVFLVNAILGGRIRKLRETKGFTQEQIAEKIDCTRQKYARVEKGVIDISYSTLIMIAKALEIDVEEITSVLNSKPQEQLMYRKGNDKIQKDDKLEFINGMLDIFYAHKKLYDSVRQVETDE